MHPLDGFTGRDGDPCAALALDVTLDAGATQTLTLLLGDAASEQAAHTLISRHVGVDPTAALDAIDARWRDVLDVVHIETPDLAMDTMVNRWLPYEALACRLTARSAFYQASGASGFRDQLQDSLAFLLHDPGIARAHILAAAGRQFPEGDVQH